jgi:hypothetical protein
MSIAALGRLPVARLTRTPKFLFVIGAWSSLALVAALVVRSEHAIHGADHVLHWVYGSVVLPLLAYAVVGTALGARSLTGSVEALVGFGASRTGAAAVAILVAALVSATLGAIVAGAVATVAHGAADPPVIRDVAASGYAGAIGGAGYASWFALGAAFGRRGLGRAMSLVLDWVVGVSGTTAALFTPRAHLRNLLGGVPPMNLSERASSIALIALTLACALIALGRARN